MNETRRQRMRFVVALLVATGFASAWGTHDVPVVNGPEPASAVTMADVTMLSALISDANRDE